MDMDVVNKLIEKAREYPGTFNMGQWALRVNKDRQHPCGTVGCLAGNAILIKGNYSLAAIGSMPFRPDSWTKTGATDWLKGGMKALGIKSEIKARRLFFVNFWPVYYQNQYEAAKSKRARARVIINRLRAFVRSDGEK